MMGIGGFMLENLRGSVRPLLTFLFALGFIYLTIIKVVSAEAFIGLATVVIKSWFDSRETKEKP
jgi:hypothetical protein